MAQMTSTDKVGQLFLMAFDGITAADAREVLSTLHPGGLALLSNATSADAAKILTANLQTNARDTQTIPPLIAIDHEGGRVQRIRGGMTVFGPPYQVGQIQPLEAAVAEASRRGTIHGQELHALGVHMSLGPVLDVWDNPDNTVIGDRSFSSDPNVVAQLGVAYAQALQQQGVLAAGKHFPGHGNSQEDSHLTLPSVSRSRATLDSVELVPFRAAIAASIPAIMTAHVYYPALDPVEDRPASLSPAVVSGLLRGELGYQGLILTDDMGAMQAITGRYESGEAAIQAVEAGTDMIIVVGPFSRQQRMVQAIVDQIGGRISMERLDASVRRVLEAKQRVGLL
jgi:beta-N-acetylhexosaminidase